MKRSYSVIFILICFFILPYSASLAQGKIFFDVKTKYLEKHKLMHIKAATEWFLSKSDWAGVTEAVSDYQLWLKNYQRRESNSQFEVKVDLELRSKKILGEGKLLKSALIVVSYKIEGDHKKADTAFEFYKNEFSSWSKQVKIEAYEAGENIVNELHEMIGQILPEKQY